MIKNDKIRKILKIGVGIFIISMIGNYYLFNKIRVYDSCYEQIYEIKKIEKKNSKKNYSYLKNGNLKSISEFQDTVFMFVQSKRKLNQLKKNFLLTLLQEESKHLKFYIDFKVKDYELIKCMIEKQPYMYSKDYKIFINILYEVAKNKK